MARTIRTFACVAATMVIAAGCVTVERFSTSSTGGQSNAAASAMRVSGDGRYVAFSSGATNLVPGIIDGNAHVYRKNRATGALTLIDVNASGSPSGGATLGSMSDDGNRVSFITDSQLVVGDHNSLGDAYVRDVSAGTTTLASLMPDGSQIPTGVGSGVFAAEFDGTGISLLMEVGAGTIPPRNRLELRNLSTSTTTEVLGNSQVTTFQFSRDGKHVFANTGCFQTGGCFPTPIVLDLANPYAFTPNFCTDAQAAGISDDGRYLAFSGGRPGPTCPTPPLRYDRTTGTAMSFGLPTSASTDPGVISMSGDARFALLRAPDDVLPGGTTGSFGFFLSDLTTGHAERVSADAANRTANAAPDFTDSARISRDGHTIVFSSGATNLVADDTNGQHDGFARIGPVPVITSTVPTSLARGVTNALVTITGLEFFPGMAATVSGGGIAVHSVTPSANGRQVVLKVSIAANAPTGPRIISIANVAAVGIAGTICGCLTIT